MAPNSPQPPKKRGRPKKYLSSEQKKEEKTKRRRIQRQVIAAKRREAQFDQFYIAVPATVPATVPAAVPAAVPAVPATVPVPLPVTLGTQNQPNTAILSAPDPPLIEDDFLEPLLPPISPVSSPDISQPPYNEPPDLLGSPDVNEHTQEVSQGIFLKIKILTFLYLGQFYPNHRTLSRSTSSNLSQYSGTGSAANQSALKIPRLLF